MKIQCDVCEKATAAVICCADEAVLCAACDVDVHAANRLAGKHQRLPLGYASSRLPRCDICQEKPAFIFCVEDRALFCRDCDEPIHVPGMLSGEHKRFLATGIRVGLSAICNKDSDKGHPEPPETSPPLIEPKSGFAVAQPQPQPQPQQAISLPSPPWAVNEFLQLSDYESTGKFQKESPLGFGELDWFADTFLPDQMPEGATAAEVPEMINTSQPSNAAFNRPNKSSISFKKPRIEISNDEEFFVVPDLG